ncbi:MAG: DUF805 domain-containing protein, partial [Myxococcales bacterium]|nr:DUF805 domain-containing protein [Myxococcales bacterium]
DRDKSGWWSALLIIPVIGWIWGLVEIGMLEGTVGPNRYGPDPIDRAGTPAGIVVRDERDSGRRG